MRDASPITHLDRSDRVAVFMAYNGTNTPVDENTSEGAWVHHVLLGLKLKEAMEKLGLECIVTDRNHPSDKYRNLQDFLIQQLRRAPAER